MAGRSSRKLAVILHADVVGSTELVQRDETLAHERIHDAFHRLSTINANFGGTTHELRGDALVAEFDRASDAVSAAIAFQVGNSEFNASLVDDIRPEVRIGIAVGEVVIADNTLTGAGVVLAQRLEQLAHTGGVCIQDAAYQSVAKRLPFEYESLGEQEVKGFEDPVRTYAVTMRPGAPVPTPELPTRAWESMPAWPKIGGTIIAFLIVLGGGLALWGPWKRDFEPASVERMAFPLPDKPSIAVLPFTNMSGDIEQEYFVDGMTEDLITDLSKLSGLFVIARNSTFTYKGKSVNVRQVAEELGVRYVLEGSVRRAGDQVRINAQLVDATTGGHLWAERYDGSLADVFALQDDVTQKIVSALAVNLTEEEEMRTRYKETGNPDAYDAFLEGWARYRLYTREDFIKAIPHFERALELDPGYGRAHAALAALYIESWWFSWRVVNGEFPESNRRAREHLQKAMRDPTPLAHRVASFLHIVENQYDEAMVDAQRAIGLDPNDPNGHEALARVLIHVGRPAESLDYIERAKRLDPRSSYLYRLGEARFHLERFEAAAAVMLKYSNSHVDNFYPFLYLAAAYGHLQRKPEAKAAFEIYKKIRASLHVSRGTSALDQVSIYYFKDGGIEEERLREGLRKAGFDLPPEVVDASPEGITLKKPADGAVTRVYEAADEHCREHGKEDILMSSAHPIYMFACR